jgi:PAS domain S-box-containing protein/putative nucleotidyltransferase with HDIG domain
MAGTVLATLQIMNCVFFNVEVYRCILDWLFVMIVITLLVHFSFWQLSKIQNALVLKEEEARESKKSLRHIIDNTKDAIVVFDKEGSFTFANKAFGRLIGYSVEKILRMNLRDIMSKEDYPFIVELLRGGNKSEAANQHYYFDLLKRNSSKVTVEMTFMPIKRNNNQPSGFQVVIRNFNEKDELEKSRQEKERYLKAIAKVGQIIIGKHENLPYGEVLEVLGPATGASCASVILNDVDVPGQSLYSKRADWYNEEKTPLVFSNYQDEAGIEDDNPGSQAEECLSPDSNNDSNMEKPDSSNSASTLILPLVTGTESAGVISFSKSPEHRGWNSMQVSLLETVASMISGAIERQRADEKLKQYFISVARALSSAMLFVDPYTSSHQQRVAAMARLVGIKLGLDTERCEWLYFGGLLHDIGKATIPTSILSKPGKLTDEEWILIKSHVKRGYEILKEIDLPEPVIDMVLNHHERLDSSGYPNGFTEDQITLDARLLAVCDVVEAMSSHRPYRQALKMEEVFAELKDNKGVKYDEKIVDLMLEMKKSEFNQLIGKSPAFIANK